MELSAALVADLSTLTEALDDADTDLAQTVLQLTLTAKGAVGSYLGLTIVATTEGHPVNLTALEHAVEPDDIRTSLRFPLSANDTHPADAGLRGVGARSVREATIELIIYAGTPGALVDLAADLGWLTGRSHTDFVFDAHLEVTELNDGLARARWTNQAIGVLIGRGYTPEHADHEIAALLTRTGWDAASATSFSPACSARSSRLLTRQGSCLLEGTEQSTGHQRLKHPPCLTIRDGWVRSSGDDALGRARDGLRPAGRSVQRSYVPIVVAFIRTTCELQCPAHRGHPASGPSRHQSRDRPPWPAPARHRSPGWPTESESPTTRAPPRQARPRRIRWRRPAPLPRTPREPRPGSRTTGTAETSTAVACQTTFLF